LFLIDEIILAIASPSLNIISKATALDIIKSIVIIIIKVLRIEPVLT
jgi:hypothetical protein